MIFYPNYYGDAKLHKNHAIHTQLQDMSKQIFMLFLLFFFTSLSFVHLKKWFISQMCTPIQSTLVGYLRGQVSIMNHGSGS